MIYMTKAKYESRMQQIKRRNVSKQRKQRLIQEAIKLFPKIKIPSTSKLVLWAGFLLFVEIIFFCQYLAVKTLDTTPLVAMIGAIGGLISMFHTYSKKSTVENSRNGIVFETAMFAQQNESKSESDESVG